MLNWKLLLSPERRKERSGSRESMNTAVGRTESERDYDRILFLAPTRRLADKAQVFPMEENDSVRTRLTHSHEVSNLARSIGVRLAFDHADTVFGSQHEELHVKRVVPSVLAAVGLAHDLGNPPFGHQGENAMREWFAAGGAVDGPPAIDFLEFDGNAQTFRLLTRLQILNDDFGLNLTFGTLAALVKYPSVFGSGDKRGFKKHGVFASEGPIIEQVWAETGLQAGMRHPLTYVMEACDDIAYSVIDAEDTVKKGYASFYDLMDFLKTADSADPVIEEVVSAARRKNSEFKRESLSSKELNDISMQMFRVKAIAKMVQAATDCFVANSSRMLDGTIPGNFELIAASNCAALCEATKRFDKRYGFQQRDVLRLELIGNNHIKSLMHILWRGIRDGRGESRPYERYVYGEISENYRRVYEATNQSVYDKCQLLCDAVSGMTETFLLKKNRELHDLADAPFTAKSSRDSGEPQIKG